MGCPRQHHPRPTAAKVTRGEPGRERLAVHRGHLAFEPRFQDLRPHRRSLLPSLEHPHASTRARPLNRRARRGPSGGSIERWYESTRLAIEAEETRVLSIAIKTNPEPSIFVQVPSFDADQTFSPPRQILLLWKRRYLSCSKSFFPIAGPARKLARRSKPT